LTSGINSVSQTCNLHNQESQFFCSCGEIICLDCIPEHKKHPDFQLRNKTNITHHFLTEFNDFKTSIEFISKNFELNNFESSLININKSYFGRFIKPFTKYCKNLIEKVSCIIDYNNPKENSEFQKLNFLSLKYKDKLTGQVLEKSKKIIELEQLVNNNTKNFLKDYQDLLVKHYPMCEEINFNPRGQKLQLIKEEINEEGEEINLLVRSVDNIIINDDQIKVKNFEESIDFTIIQEEERESQKLNSIIKNTNRFSDMKMMKTKSQKKCVDCDKMINSSEDYIVRCWSCYNKYKNKK
jgi:hypothetical protein